MTDAASGQPSAADGAQVRVVLFDIGGVLARFAGLAVLQRLTGIESELEVAARWLMSPWVRRFESGACTDAEFAAGIVAEWELPFSPAQFLDQFPAWLEDPFDGAEQLLRDTGRAAEVGCLSNTNSLQWRTLISHWPLSRLFEHRFLSFELGAVKPDLEIYRTVIDRLAVAPEHVLFLDDNPLNVDGARRAGLRAEQTLGVAQARDVLERHGLLG